MDKFLQSGLKPQVSEEGRGAKHTHTHTHSALHDDVRMEERFLLEGSRLRDDKGNVFRRSEHPHERSLLATLHTINLLNKLMELLNNVSLSS